MVEKTNGFGYHPDDQVSQLEVLRNILFGDIVAHYEHRINDLEAQLLKTDDKLENKITKMDANIENKFKEMNVQLSNQALNIEKQFKEQRTVQDERLTIAKRAMSTEIKATQKIVVEKIGSFEEQNNVAKVDLASMFIHLGEKLKDNNL